MNLLILILTIMLTNINRGDGREASQSQKIAPFVVKKCSDFDLTGKDDGSEWSKTEWNYLTKLDEGGKIYTTKFKILYSEKGIYVLFTGEDDKISTRYDQDFDDLFKGDVYEVFFHTDPNTTVYFEYEINQLNKELVLLVPKINGSAYGWIPWHYKNERAVKKKIEVKGGKMISNGAITSWSAELFFPYELFMPLGNVPPKSGTIWNANFYRLDYDTGKMIKWAWGPVQKSFHELDKFRPIKFE